MYCEDRAKNWRCAYSGGSKLENLWSLHTPRPNFFRFHENISNNSLALPLGSAPPLRNPGSATECILMIEHGLKAYLENSEVLSGRVSSSPEIRNRDLWFQGEDDTTTQKGLTWKCRRITSLTTFLPLLKRGDLCGVIPSTTVLWPVHNPVPFKQACIYTTEDMIVCDEIYVSRQIVAWILSQHPHRQLKCWVPSQFQPWDSNLGPPIPRRRRYHYTKGSDPKVRKNHLRHYNRSNMHLPLSFQYSITVEGHIHNYFPLILHCC